MTDISRNLEAQISRLLTLFPVVMLVGARQTGKTTLSRMGRAEWQYFDLENATDYDFISRDYDFFFQEHPNHIIFDEAQELPELFRHLRGVIDAKRKQTGRFIITGSSSPDLLKQASDSLAGRIAIVEIGTLKMNEHRQQTLPPIYQMFEQTLSVDSLDYIKSLDCPIDDVIPYFLHGGYPEPTLIDDSYAYNIWMENYYQTYVNRDVKKLFPRLDSIRYRRFVAMLSSLSGTIINKAQLGRSVDVSEVTIRDYLTGINSREILLRSAQVGHNFESFIIEEIIKGIQASKVTRWDYYYYRTKNGAEIDLILEGSFGLLPIEIKFGQKTTLKQFT